MFLIEWLLEVFKEFYRLYEDNLSSGGPTARMQRQLRLMYGRGEIDKKTFHKLLNILYQGYSIDGELKSAHRQAVARLEAEGKLVFGLHNNADIARSFDKLYLNRAALEEIRLEIAHALQIIETTGALLQNQVETTYENARSALPHEEIARGYLEMRHDMLERIQYLSHRSEVIQKNLRQIDALEAELGIYEAELIFVETQEHYAESILPANKMASGH